MACRRSRPGTATARPVPVLAPSVSTLLGDAFTANILKFVYGGNGTNVPAPPCKQQPRFSVQGKITRFPQVGADIKGLEPGLPQP